MSRALLLAMAAGLAAGAESPHDAKCAACTILVADLVSALAKTKDDLAKSKQTNEDRAAEVGKVQKAQTKRWLKQEYGVALRAAVEDRLETVCAADEIAVSKALRTACASLVEEHEEGLADAVIVGEDEGFCAANVRKCGADRAAAARARYAVAGRSEIPPADDAADARAGPGRLVWRLVGSTYSLTVGKRDAHTLVMLHTSSPPEADGLRATPYSAPYSAAADAFYALARAADTADLELRFCQLDLRHNDVPYEVELADEAGVSFQLWLKNDKTAPRPVPAVGEPSLAGVSETDARSRLVSLLSTYLGATESAKLRAAISKLRFLPPPKELSTEEQREEMEAEARREAKARDRPPPPAAGKTEPPKPPKPEAPSPPKRERRKARGKAEIESRRRAECEVRPPSGPHPRTMPAKYTSEVPSSYFHQVCGVYARELRGALSKRKGELKLSHEAAARKQAYIDGVQKAQTKRWLKREYGAELAAAVEDRNDGVCEDKKLRDATCKAAAWKGGDDGEGSELHAAVVGVSKETKEGEKAAVDRCDGLFKRACVQVRDEKAEAVIRAVLDGVSSSEMCAEMLTGCDEARAAIHGGGKEEEDDDDDDDEEETKEEL